MTAKHKFINPNKYYGRLFFWLVPLFIFVLGWHTADVSGQISNSWSEPVNLSQSGAAAKPQLFVTTDNALHAIWQDEFVGYMYTRWITDSVAPTESADEVAPYFPPLNDFDIQGQQTAAEGEGFWARPQAITPPFGTRAGYPDLQASDPTPLFEPVLVADSDNNVNAWWINEENRLFYSQVAADSFALTEAWQVPQFIRPDVVQVSAAVDISDTLHVAYVSAAQGVNEPAGVYYLQKASNAVAWSGPIQLYESAYFRQIGVAEAQIQIIAGLDGMLFVVWDDPFSERVYLGRSLDEGQSWDEPLLIDQRTVSDSADSVGPSGIKIAFDGHNLHLLWLAGHNERTCSLYHSWSTNNGELWKTPKLLSDGLTICPTSYELVPFANNLILTVSDATQGFLFYWKGLAWSDPQLETQLSRFVHPATFRPISYSCAHRAITHEDSLLVIGCTAENGNDIWLTSKSTQQILSSLKPTNTIWESASALFDSSLLNGQDLTLIPNANNHLHAVWSAEHVTEARNLNSPLERKLVYAFWDGGNWSKPTAVLSSPTGKKVEKPSVAINAEQNLLVVWEDSEGLIYFSKVLASEAAFFSSWSLPIPLNSPTVKAESPQIIVGEDEHLYVTYAVPFNEGRGIYLITSKDNGDSWSEPTLILDGSALTIINQPYLTLNKDGGFYLTALHWEDPTAVNSLATLYDSRSIDGGQSWSAARIVQDRQNQLTHVIKAQALTADNGVLHRIWQDKHRNEIELWHQQSYDYGQTWTNAIRLSTIGQPVGAADLVIDAANTPHLLQIVFRSNQFGEAYVLQHWTLQDERWLAQQSLELGSDLNDEVELSAAITSNQQLVIAYSAELEQEDFVVQGFISADQVLDVPAANIPSPISETAVQPLITPTPIVLPTIAPTPQTLEENIALPEVIINNPNRLSAFLLGFDPMVASVLLTVTLVGSLIATLVAIRFLRYYLHKS